MRLVPLALPGTDRDPVDFVAERAARLVVDEDLFNFCRSAAARHWLMAQNEPEVTEFHRGMADAYGWRGQHVDGQYPTASVDAQAVVDEIVIDHCSDRVARYQGKARRVEALDPDMANWCDRVAAAFTRSARQIDREYSHAD